MDEIKNLFIKHFGFFPDVISTTEHAFISPTFRIISSLVKLSEYKNKKVLRLVITDEFSVSPKSCISNISLPHILNKNLFKINKDTPKLEIIKNFDDSLLNMDNILKEHSIFTLDEINNYRELIFMYKSILEKSRDVNIVSLYNNILLSFFNSCDLSDFSEWVQETDVFAIDSLNCKLFVEESFLVLSNKFPQELKLFGEYLEKNKRLKYKDINNNTYIISLEKYMEMLTVKKNICTVPFEIILFIYSYCEGSHFGNDYNMVNDIKKIRNLSKLVQLTKHNKDCVSDFQLENVKFQKVDFIKNKWSLSHKMYKAINTMPELYVVLGKEGLKKIFKF